MNIIFFTHPDFLGSQSMPRFTRMLTDGMERCGHKTEIWTPKARAHNLPAPRSLKKWLGYIDQFLIFPAEVRTKLQHCSPETLFVFIDQALGPWVPLVADRPHVIHCHDFLAQLSALGAIPENPTSWTGRIYQRYIRKGYRKGRNFISVSESTRRDLHRLLGATPKTSEMVYNGLNGNFEQQDPTIARAIVSRHTGLKLEPGYILHVGGNQWYKNRAGVIEIYNAWRSFSSSKLPLLLVGYKPSAALQQLYLNSPYKDDIYWVSNLNDEMVKRAYAGANVPLFPSLAEGFGWPIAEAMACGCPVVTTDQSPMTEVAGSAGYYISRRPVATNDAVFWATESASQLEKLLTLPDGERAVLIQKGIANASRFNTELTIKKINEIYQKILKPQTIAEPQLSIL